MAQQSVDPSKNASDQVTPTSTTQESETAESGSTVNGVLEPHTEEDKGQGNSFTEHRYNYLFKITTSGNSGNSSTKKILFLADKTTPELCSIGKCKAIYNFTPEHDDELALNEGKWH